MAAAPRSQILLLGLAGVLMGAHCECGMQELCGIRLTSAGTSPQWREFSNSHWTFTIGKHSLSSLVVKFLCLALQGVLYSTLSGLIFHFLIYLFINLFIYFLRHFHFHFFFGFWPCRFYQGRKSLNIGSTTKYWWFAVFTLQKREPIALPCWTCSYRAHKVNPFLISDRSHVTYPSALRGVHHLVFIPFVFCMLPPFFVWLIEVQKVHLYIYFSANTILSKLKANK